MNYYIIHMANPRITWNDIVAGLKPMLCIETWSFGMRHDVWLTELSGLRPTGWEERKGVRGSVRPWLLAYLTFGGLWTVPSQDGMRLHGVSEAVILTPAIKR